jgi:hypothetical protein
MHLNVIHPNTSRFSWWSYAFLFSLSRATRPAHLILLDLILLIRCYEDLLYALPYNLLSLYLSLVHAIANINLNTNFLQGL